MRIGLFSDTFPPEINGVANSTNILRNELEKHGHEVYVITTFSGTGHAKWDDDKKVLRLAGFELKFLYGYVMTSPFHIHALEEISQLHLDLIHVQTEFGVGIFARICAHQLNIPLVSTYHTTYEDYTHYVNFINSKTVDSVAKKGVAKISKLYGDTSMEVIAPSLKTKNMLEGYHIRKNIDVIPTGLDLDKFSPKHLDLEFRHTFRSEFGVSDDEKLIIYVGRLAQEKSMDLIIKGFHEAIKQGTTIKLLIVGGGPDFDSCQQLINEFGIQEYVKMVGPRPATEVPHIYRAADAFVSASLSETQGMTFIEALAAGLPIIVRHDEVLDDLCIEGKTGIYFSDEFDLANKIKEFLGYSDEQLTQMKDNAVEIVKPYSSEVFYQRVLKVYQRVIDAYRHHYIIEDIKVKGNTVQLYLISNQKEEVRLQVSLDDFYFYGMRKGSSLISRQVEELKAKEESVIAYQSCIKKITVKDRTRKEMYDWLTQNTKCDIETINDMIDVLEEKGYINDERYCREQVDRLKSALFGRERIIRTLKKKGLSYEMIVQIIDEEPSEELEHALEYSNKILKTHESESTSKLKNVLNQKLHLRGFATDIISEVLQQIDFTDSVNNEMDNLKKCATKAKKRYSRKYSGSDLRNRVYQYCCAQGFSSEKIYIVMNEMEWD